MTVAPLRFCGVRARPVVKLAVIGTLVQQTTFYTILGHMPTIGGPPSTQGEKSPTNAEHGAEAVRATISWQLLRLPALLRYSLAWDQGTELASHARPSIDTGTAIYLANPNSPWRCSSIENTNGLLRQYFPKGTELARWHREDLDTVDLALSGRPPKTVN